MKLTPTEKLIFVLLVNEGLTDREIGDRMRMKPRAVKWHVSSILAKFDVPSRMRLMALVWQDRLHEELERVRLPLRAVGRNGSREQAIAAIATALEGRIGADGG